MGEMKTIQAGELNRRVQILRRIAEQGEDGFYTGVREQLVHGCWAKVTADFSEVKARFLIRHTAKRLNNDMFVRFEGREYEITYINDYAGHKYMEIWGTWKQREG